jgi:hypothetical protein
MTLWYNQYYIKISHIQQLLYARSSTWTYRKTFKVWTNFTEVTREIF